MTAQPQWEPTDQADLLALVAQGSLATDTADKEWDLFSSCLVAAAAGSALTINPNRLRRAINGRIKPQRVGAFTHRALRAGLIAYTGQYVVSDDKHGGNAGKPCREMRWIGGES